MPVFKLSKSKPKLGYKMTTSPGKIVQKGKPTEVSQSFKRGAETRTYTKEVAYTGHPAYGKDNPSKPQPKFVTDAQSKKQDIAYHNGLPYRAGRTTTHKEPDRFATAIKVTPQIQMRTMKMTPIGGGEKKSAGKLKPMSVTFGGSSKKNPDRATTGTGLGTSKGIIRKKIKVH